MKEEFQLKRAEIDVRLGRVHTEEVAFTFCRINSETSFQGPFFEVVKGLLMDQRRVGPDSMIITWQVFGPLEKGPRKAIDK